MDIYQDVTNRIIESLESGVAPWIKSWSNKALTVPHNAHSKRPYSGVNILLLWASGIDQGFSSNGWMTYKQAQEAGGQVKKGSKGTKIVFFKPLEKRTEVEPGVEKVETIPLARAFTVFNIDQIDGIEYESPVSVHSNMLEVCNQVGARVLTGPYNPCYIPSADVIQMPDISDFDQSEQFEAVLAHELTHWTGPKKRLNRDLSGRFGDESYAAEELIAELGAAFICAEYGLTNPELRHDSYIQSWLKVLKNDKRAIFTAASKAQQACNYIKEQALQEIAA